MIYIPWVSARLQSFSSDKLQYNVFEDIAIVLVFNLAQDERKIGLGLILSSTYLYVTLNVRMVFRWLLVQKYLLPNHELRNLKFKEYR